MFQTMVTTLPSPESGSLNRFAWDMAGGDSPAFLQNTSLGAQVTQAHRQLLRNLTAVVADHADPMADPQQDPDRPHYHVTRTAVACRALGPPPLT